MQRNEGQWDFTMEEAEDGGAIILEVWGPGDAEGAVAAQQQALAALLLCPACASNLGGQSPGRALLLPHPMQGVCRFGRGPPVLLLSSNMLQVDVGKYLDTSLIKADVQPSLVRLLIKGRLLQVGLAVWLRVPGRGEVRLMLVPLLVGKD